MREEGGRRRTHVTLFCPVTYEDEYLRTTAERLNFIAYLAMRDASVNFEARRFLYELYRAVLAYWQSPARRA